MTANDNTSGATFSRVPDLAALVFSGADAASFLQGQLSNDILALPETGGWQRTAYCSPKGRMLANFILCRRNFRENESTKVESSESGKLSESPEYVALLSADIADETAKRLRMFVLRAKVNIARAPAAFVFAQAESEAGTVPETESDSGMGCEFSDRDDALVIGEGSGRKLLCCMRGDAERLLPAGVGFCGDDSAWRRAQIAGAVPWVRSETRDMFIPQMVNYELPPLSGVSFQKGCYVGQEVVARLHYRGKVKRRSRPATGRGSPGEVPSPGAVLRDADGTAVGNIVDAVANPDATPDGNGFLSLSCAQVSAGELFLEDGRPLKLLPSPHPIPESSD